MKAPWIRAASAALLAGLLAAPLASGGEEGARRKWRGDRSEPGPDAALSQVLGRPTDRSIALSVLSASAIEAYAEFGETKGGYDRKTEAKSLEAGAPAEFEIADLKPDARYFYRLRSRRPGEAEFAAGPECAFQTQRAPGRAFTFALQGDTHVERPGKMYDPGLYAVTLRNAAADAPDFYLTMGDDFSIERLIEHDALDQANVDRVYAHHRGFLGLVGRSSPLFLVNGNHEQAALHWIDGTSENAGVYAGRARTRFYPLPAPDAFYGGNAEPVEFVGPPRDYYSWTWGDALFAVIDFYWHSTALVDTDLGGGKGGKGEGEGEGGREGQGGKGEGKGKGKGKNKGGGGGRGRDLWQVTLGETQYRWLAKTLTDSRARFKFVFVHQVLGTGRGGAELAGLFEWGGRDKRGEDLFAGKRPGWEQPIHALLAKTGVTVLFHAHDHLFARQALDGVVYQSVPNPADSTYTAFNSDAFRSGDVLPNSGHLRVRVSPEEAKVEYVRAFRPADETAERKNGSVAFSYAIPAPAGAAEGEKR